MTHSQTHFSIGNDRNGHTASVRRGPVVVLLAALSAGILLFLIQLYRWLISPAQTFLFGANAGCRFTPTCSQYAVEAIRGHGAIAGSVLAFKRVCRCNPFVECGHDPVPRVDAGAKLKEKN
jgi:uncharacterized protein